MNRLPLETQTLYAEFVEQLTALEAQRAIGHLPGCFTLKTVKGIDYYYYQHTDPGGAVRQIYIGRKSGDLDRLVQAHRLQREYFASDVEPIQRLCAQLRIGGALVTDSSVGRVLKALADSGVFHLDGVLLGTQAFIVLGNLLGFQWEKAALRTQDIDLGGRANMSLGLCDVQANIPKALEGLQMGFLPVPSMNPRDPVTSFKVRGHSLRVDLLTPEKRSAQDRPVYIRRFQAAAQPLRFLDYLMEGPVKGAVVDGGGILVNVPQPARFALHKLIISREREVTAHSKVQKDLFQAAQLLAVLLEERPGDLRLAWEAIQKLGPGWVKRVREALSNTSSPHREIFDRTKTMLKI
ncbi:MAG: GSU2403 family nucleotidyltransferase fold protein [Desulfobacterota bacterium]|nr:GSU2403 family nucleotidyltransferase fold protein [Thermodesulfobacteriota bacterium]